MLRPGGLLLAFLLALGCVSAAPEAPALATVPPRSELLARAAQEFLEIGSPRSADVLASGGEEARSWLRSIREQATGERRLQATSLLLSTGEDMHLPVAEEVGILLFDLRQQDERPVVALRSLARLRDLGPSALPALREASAGQGAEAATARRLLRVLSEVNR